MMKLLITTRADENVAGWAELSHPLFVRYARAVGATFRILDRSIDSRLGHNLAAEIAVKGDVDIGLWHFRIMSHYDLHEEYDRILHLDSDILLTPRCRNLFEVVPPAKIGTIYEDVGSRQVHRRECMVSAQRKFGWIGWEEGYVNTGVFLTSRAHRDIFSPINGEYFTDWGTDDVHLGYQIKKQGHLVEPLPYQFNHMTMFSEPWNDSADRFESEIIHYAGAGVFDAGMHDKLEQARIDFRRLYGG